MGPVQHGGGFGGADSHFRRSRRSQHTDGHISEHRDPGGGGSVAQVQSLAAQLSEVQIRVRQVQADVSLIRALGGGWTVKALPDEKQTLQFTESDYAVAR
jgi:hypothetical protein